MIDSNNRIGEINYNKFGSKMVIVKYNKSNDVWIEFEQGNLIHTAYKNFKKGTVGNPYDRSVCGVGYFGEGSYKARIEGKLTRQYQTWSDMLKRCYYPNRQEKSPTYIGCTVDNEWHNFQVFAKWFDDNYYEIEGQKMNLDKDIIENGNKIYSPNTCIFVPQNINKLFIKCDSKRGQNPIGVYFNSNKGKYVSQCAIGNSKQIHLGYFNTSKEAFQVYKTYKESFLKQVAEQYKNKIPTQLYNAMMSYRVEISD